VSSVRGECECGATERPCKVDPIRLNQLPEIKCCVETTLSGRECEQTEETRCPSGQPEVRDQSGNIISSAIPASHCDHDREMCVYEFTTMGEPDLMEPSCSYDWEQEENAGSSELVLLYVLEPDHAVELELVAATFDVQMEIATSDVLNDGQLSECPGTDMMFCSPEARYQGTQYFDNTNSVPTNIWVVVEGAGIQAGNFTVLWKTRNMCTYGKTCHDGSCVEARPCQDGWYAGVPTGSLVSVGERRAQIQVPSRWIEVSPAESGRHLSPEECALEVQIAEPNANGATFQQGLCFAEMDLQVRASALHCLLVVCLVAVE
jgi:hypothetical protein